VGTTVFGSVNGTAGNSLSQLNLPWSVTINTDKSMLITDMNNIRVLRVYPNASTGVIVASAGPWLQSRRALFDSDLLNLFVVDSDFCRMTRYYNGSLTDTIMFGSTCGTNLTQIGGAASFCMDSAGNFYIADNNNHRIMFWTANGTSGVLLAGTTGVSGSDVLHLYCPEDITLDEAQGLLYVADTFNHRIIRYSLGSPSGTVVAGGNGPGVGRK
jgi:sugar lactone lactonase YvrE